MVRAGGFRARRGMAHRAAGGAGAWRWRAVRVSLARRDRMPLTRCHPAHVLQLPTLKVE